MKLLEDALEFMLRKDGDDDALEDDDDKSSVESVILEQVKEHVEAESAGLTPDHSSQLIREAGEEGGTCCHACPHPLTLITWRSWSWGKPSRPQIILKYQKILFYKCRRLPFKIKT